MKLNTNLISFKKKTQKKKKTKKQLPGKPQTIVGKMDPKALDKIKKELESYSIVTIDMLEQFRIKYIGSNGLFKDLFKEAKNTLLEKIPPHLGISLKEVKELLSTLESNFSYFKPWFWDAGDKSTMAAETISLISTKSIPKIGISNFGSGKKTQCNILRFFENSATSICNFLKPFAL